MQKRNWDLATFRCKNRFSNFADYRTFYETIGVPSAQSIVGSSWCCGAVFQSRGVFLWCCLALRGQKFADMNQVVRDDGPANPSFHPIHPSVTTPPQPMPSFENTDPPFASHPPTLRSAKPTLLLLPGSGLIPTLPIGNRHPLDP